MTYPRPVTIAIVGAGMRGAAYAKYALQCPDLAKVVAVAEPRAFQREQLAAAHAIPAENVFHSWEDLVGMPQIADALVIATQDSLHKAPMLALAPKGYAVLMEKPMATTLDDCEQIVACAKRHGTIFAVCHVLLYMEFTTKLMELLNAGAIGELVSIQQLEPVGWWHQGHSFVRGNWRRTADTGGMLLAKSCHDLDWMRHVMGRHCRRVASFGSLRHFRASQKPAGAGERCMDCSIEPTCPYSAKRFYLEQFGRDWINLYCVEVITDDHTREGVEKALREGPYGRCVYACDNDVVDNQVAILEFDGPGTATFTMTAFAPASHRKTRLFGTRGYIETDGVKIELYDFVSEKSTVIDTNVTAGATAAEGHGGSDYYLMKAFTEAVAASDQSKVWSGPDATLESHRIVFAAERARLEGRVVELAELAAESPEAEHC